ncbi:PAS domain S-box protein [Methylocystis echinoides]|jgi:PAS domain S-box-containing protein|uniref:sensor histidine kinase n=1 Tax=Methylocystis echinoides TaxID=29468 RepID=UPI00344959F5
MTKVTDRLSKCGGPGSDELLRLLVDSATDFAIIAMNSRGEVTSWNAGAERLLGYREEEILSHSGDVIFAPEDCAAGVPERERAEARARGRAEDERWHQRKDGSRFWGSGVMMRLADGSGFVKIFRNLTERRAAEQRVRESEELFRLLATNIPQLVFRTKRNGARSWGSPQWIAFTGLSLEDSLGFGWVDAVHPEDREDTLAAWTRAWESGEYYVEHRFRRVADGEFRWHQTRAKPVADIDGDWVGTSTDVHDMREFQERQQILLAELQHRTSNLLAVVQSIARQTMRASRSLDGFAAEFDGRLRALSRVQGLLARPDHGPVDLRELVEMELEAHGGGHLDRDKVTIDGPSVMLPANVAQALALAIHELATNAVKYGALKQPSGKMGIRWRIEDGEAEERRVALEWRETGVDMPDQGDGSSPGGYGRELIERALPYQLKAKTSLEFGPDGVRCRITVVLEREESVDG